MSDKEQENKPINWKISLILCLLIGAGAYAILRVIDSTEPKAQRVGATKKSAMLVDVLQVSRGTYKPLISLLGKVEPAVDVMLSPQVSGEITFRAEHFTPGGFVKSGQVLYKINKDDYENSLKQKESQLRQAQTELRLEEGRRNIALEEYRILNQKLADKNKDLILRVPQMEAVQAQIDMAEASVEKAKIDLSRTEVKAPFDALVLTRSKDVGSQVSPGEALGRLVGLENYWVSAAVPLSKLKWIQFPSSESDAVSRVTLSDRNSWGQNVSREGKVWRMIGDLEEKSMMARILITVKDPLCLKAENKSKPALIVGVVLRVDIEGRALEGVRVPRKYIRAGDTAWVMKDDKLKINQLDIILKDKDYAYVRKGLEDGDKIVISNLSRVVDGASLRVEKLNSDGS